VRKDKMCVCVFTKTITYTILLCTDSVTDGVEIYSYPTLLAMAPTAPSSRLLPAPSLVPWIW
jgi:hypothetical protein